MRKIRAPDVMSWVSTKVGGSDGKMLSVLVVLFAMMLNGETDKTEIESQIRKSLEN